MRFLYHLNHGAQLFEEDGVDHSKSGWHDHPEKAGLVAIIDPNGPTQWVRPAKAAPKKGEPQPEVAAGAQPEPTPEPEPEPEPVLQEPVWAEIPADWADAHWMTQCKIASAIKGEPVTKKPEAVDVIEAELARRSA